MQLALDPSLAVLPGVYAAFATFYDGAALCGLWPQHRAHPLDRRAMRARFGAVARRVAALFALQAVLSVLEEWLFAAPTGEAAEAARSFDGLRVLAGTAALDTYQYWAHRLVHGRWLYRPVHHAHHTLRAPFAWGALYNSYSECLLCDVPSFAFARWACGMSAAEALALGALASAKTACDHGGYVLPWDPLAWFPGNAAYHHQHHVCGAGNFQQPFYTFWDNLMGTRLGGGERERRSS